MKRTALILAFVALIGFTAAAQQNSTNINTAIVASTANYPDAMVGAAASSKIGAPVLLTGKNKLSASTKDTLKKMSVDQAVILGGPAVISKDVEAEIDSEVNSTTRLWGVSQTGTSIEISKYFWTESDRATIIQYPLNSENGYRLLSAVNKDEPILISKPGTISASVLSEVKRLGATQVDVYSTEAVNTTSDLKEIGVKHVKVNEGRLENLAKDVEDRTEAGNASNLVVIAAANFRHSLIVPSTANGDSILIGSEKEIGRAVKAASKASIREVKVAGKPDLAKKIAERIRNQTQKKVQVISGRPAETAAEKVRNHSREWSRIQERRREHWKQRIKKSKGLQKSANATLVKANASVTVNSSQRSHELLSEARKAYEKGEYFKARKKATMAASQANLNRFRELDREKIRNEYRDETEDLRAAASEMGRLNKKMASRLKDAKSKEKRLEIVDRYREKRKDIRERRREEKKKRRNDREDNRTSKQEEGETEPRNTSSDEGLSPETEPRNTSSDEGLSPGKSKIEFHAEDSKISSNLVYLARTGGYSINSSSSSDGNSVSFKFMISSPSGPATEVLTRMKASSTEKDLAPGNYTVNASVSLDGKVIDRAESKVSVKG
ncbi:MAG: cell wall-binding repeat-containing protein [Candidatus Nanohalobium sp.]